MNCWRCPFRPVGCTNAHEHGCCWWMRRACVKWAAQAPTGGCIAPLICSPDDESQVRVTDQHGGESLKHFALQPREVVVADNGYGSRRRVATVVSQQADAVLRITPSTFPLQEPEGREVDVLAWLQSPGEPVRSKHCCCWWEQKCSQVRLIASRLPPKEAETARQRKIQRAKDKGKPVTEEMLFLAGWVLLITTLPEPNWSEAEVLRLYRARGPAELVYKRMKQLLRLKQIRSTTPEGAQATVRAFLVAWARPRRGG